MLENLFLMTNNIINNIKIFLNGHALILTLSNHLPNVSSWHKNVGNSIVKLPI